jgi:hypothetical protein
MRASHPLLSAFLIAFSLPLAAQTIQVGLEPMPPLINDANSGYTINLLRAIEGVSTLKFNIVIMPYSRGRLSLKNSEIDLLGHTPYQSETKDFYQFAQEVKWSAPVKTDFYALKPEHLKPGPGAKVGVPRGNKDFASEVSGVPTQQIFDGADLDGLVQMLALGRLDAIWWERASTMATIKQLKAENILYKEVPGPSAGLAVRTDAKGSKLKADLEAALKKVDTKKLFAAYSIYTGMPASGTVSVK